ncbi:hypothetical protein FACS189449_02490 [Alphaproteobacteria bacterium]|nr:hypothetical protein FACS189449_02490 [Alphaproteobacteria bacterium]
MKKSIKSICKIVFGLCSTVVLVSCIVVGMFFFDAGRDILLQVVTQYFKTMDTVFVIEKLNRDLTKIQKIQMKTPDGVELIFSNISMDRKHITDRSSIYIDEFILNGSDEEIDINQKLKELIPLMRILRIFIADLSLGNGILNIAGSTHLLGDLQYKSVGNSDRLYSKIDQKRELDVLFAWDGSECINSEIKFKNFSGFSGILFIYGPEKIIANYKLDAANELIKIKSDGSYENFLSDIKIKNAFVQHQNKNYNIFGNLYIKSKKADLNAMVNLHEFTKDLPENIKQNFTDIVSVVNAKYDFNDCSSSHAEVFFRKFGEDVGKLNCDFQNNVLWASGDIGWIDIFGFKPKKLQCKLDNFQDISLNIDGEDFDLTTNAKIDDKIHVNDLKLVAKNAGYLSSSKPFDISKEATYAFEFDFNNMEFWNRFAPISGNCSGKFLCNSDAILSAKCSSKHFVFDGNSLDGAEITLDGENINIKSKNANLYKKKCSDLQFSLKGEQANVSCIMSDNFSLQAAGKLCKSEKKISLAKCVIKSPEALCNFDVCNLDFLNNVYKVSCHLSSSKGASIGTANISCNGRNADVRIDAFQTNWLHKLSKNIPVCKLDCSLKLALDGGPITGQGDVSISGLLPKKNIVNVKLNTTNGGVNVKANVNRKDENISVDAFLPIVFQSDGTIKKDIRGKNFMCHVLANCDLEHLLDLTDKIDIRGKLKCDLHVGGTVANPAVTGTATLQNAHFVINDITLRNGTISLAGNGGNSLNVSGVFVDSKKQKLTVNGNCILSLKDAYPNISANLGLHFDKYKLLDSDNITAFIVGDGKITGSIDDLLISGKVIVPECNIKKLDSDSSANKGDIIIENEKNIIDKTKKTSETAKDFLKYNIEMDCRKINLIGNVFEITLNGNLRLSTYNDEATLIGSLGMTKGRLNLFGKRMEATKGSAIFSKEHPFDPDARFECSHIFGDLTAHLDIKNRPGKGVKIDLYSFPKHSKDTVLSHILFGKNLQDLTGFETAQLYHALKSVNGNGYIFSILNTFQNIGVIDSLSFSTADKKTHSLNTDSSRSEKNMNLSAGKHLGDNVYISVNKTPEGASFDVDLSITQEMSIKANTRGEAGISWKYRY